MKVKELVAQLCLILRDPMDFIPPGSSFHGILQVRIPGGLPFPSPGELPNPGIELTSLVSPALAGRFFTTSANLEADCLLNSYCIPLVVSCFPDSSLSL